jgi:deazaflavin-dependent oxidoreductase (nitroreductase family)
MQMNRSRRTGIALVRGFSRFLLTLAAIVGSFYLGLLGLTVLLRIKPINDRLRPFSSRVDKTPLIRKIAGSRLGSLYFNLSTLKHVGRKSGREYVTHLAAFPLGDGFVLTLAYGPNVDWCRNIMASGKCTLTFKGREYELERPELIPISEAWAAYPPITKLFALAGGMKQGLWVHMKQVVPEPARAHA